MTITVYHNPRCSKSRQTLALINESKDDVEIVEYLKSPPTKSEFKNILEALGMKPREVLRTKEPEYKALGLDKESLSDDQIIDLMLANPKLIERPIVVSGNSAVLGRPPENVLDIL